MSENRYHNGSEWVEGVEPESVVEPVVSPDGVSTPVVSGVVDSDWHSDWRSIDDTESVPLLPACGESGPLVGEYACCASCEGVCDE